MHDLCVQAMTQREREWAYDKCCTFLDTISKDMDLSRRWSWWQTPDTHGYLHHHTPERLVQQSDISPTDGLNVKVNKMQTDFLYRKGNFGINTFFGNNKAFNRRNFLQGLFSFV